MSFLIKDDEVQGKYDKIWNVIKNKLNINFHSEAVYEYKYLKTKIREFNGEIKINFWIMVRQKKIYFILALLA